MRVSKQNIIFLLTHLLLYPLFSTAFSFPSFEWINKQIKNHKKDAVNQKLLDRTNTNSKDSIVFPSENDSTDQEIKDFHLRNGPKKPSLRSNLDKGQELEDFHFNQKPQDHKGQEIEEINFGHKADHPKEQELEEFHFAQRPEEHKGQELEDFHFGQKPEDHKGQETEEINFGHKPDHPKGQELEDFHFGQKPEDHKGQEIEEINFGHKPEEHKGQELEEFRFGQKPEDHKGQEVEEINFGHKLDHPKGQELEDFHFGQKPEDHKEQEVEEINFGHKPDHPKGQELEDFHFGQKPEDHKGQEIEEINFGHKSEEHKGQELEEFHFGQKPEDHKGQEVEEINFGHKPNHPKGQELEDFHFGQKPKHHKEQETEEINFGHKPDHPKGQELEDFHFGQKPENHKEQEVEEINFGHKPEEHKGQELEDFHFGQKPEDHKEQEVEEINFGHKPEEHKGQELEDFHFDQKPKDHKGQEVEEINFGHKPDHPKGQELEDFHFDQKPEDHKGQETEEINFGHKTDHPKGQELEDFHFDQKPEDHKGQETEEINFGHKPDHPKGQELEDFHFDQKPEDHKGQEVEEINFGHKPDHPKGQELEDFHFGQKPEDHKGQEIEEINFGHKPEEHKGQELEEFHFGQKPEDHKGQETEEINFGHKPEDQKGPELEDFHFGQKPEDQKGQEVEEINFGHKPEEHKGQELEDFHFGQKPEDQKGQELEDFHFGHKPEDQKGQEHEDFHFGQKPEDHKGQEVEEINFGHKPENPKGQELDEFNFGSDFREPKDNSILNSNDFDETGGHWFDIFLPSEKNEGCKDKPETPTNSYIRCESERRCKATCHYGYNFPDNREALIFECEDNKWVIFDHDGLNPNCEPSCVPPCQNGGVCTAPNQCDCQKNFQGPQCQFLEKPCFNHPPVSQNSYVHCNSSNCVVECFQSYFFPDGSSVANLVCHDGQWTLDRNDWNSLPDCKPSCHPPCINGGNCLDFNKCQCPRQYAGPQCQYEIAACDGEKLNFNGYYTCRGESDLVTCSLSCPEGHTSDIPLASEYICHYSTGKFLPEPVPKCIYGKDTEVIKFASSSHTVHENLENLESSKIKPHPVEKHPSECTTWKGSHYKTFDGKVFSFRDNCSYTLVQDIDNEFRVVIENPNCNENFCHRILNIYYQDKTYKVIFKDGDLILSVNDLLQPIPMEIYGVSVERDQDQIFVSLQEPDVNIIFNKQDHLTVKVNVDMWNKTSGLCGNFNGNPDDDFTTPGGLNAWNLELFVKSWVTDMYTCQAVPDIDTLCSDNSAVDYCNKVLTDSHFESCLSAGILQSYKDACMWDVCNCGKSCACATIQSFVESCKKDLVRKGFPDSTSEWRQISDCAWNCPAGKIYSSCGPSMEVTCGSFQVKNKLEKYSECVEGCFCPEGTVLHNDTCIRKENCPCQWLNKSYGSGEKITKGCNTCTCQSGEWLCTNLKCESRCSLTGNSHYLTFDGKRYDFMGQCSYYLLKSNNYTIESANLHGSGDKVIEDIFNSLTSEYSSTKTVTIHHGKDKIQLKRLKEVFVNEIEASSLPVLINGVIIRSASSLYLRVTLPDNTDIWWDGNTNVYIDIPGNQEEQTKGLCGTFNDNQGDDFITPEGDVEQSVISFAEKWKKDETCKELLDPLQPHPCDLNINKKIIAEKYCQKLKDNAFKDCHSYVDVSPFYKNCLYDVCSCQNDLKSCACSIFSDYGNECIRHNVEVPWRYEIRECGLHCPPGEVYQACGDSCARTCQDISFSGNHHCVKKCVEGCNCPEGLTLNDLGQCIPISKCPCAHQNKKYKPNQQIIMENSNGPQFCTCENAIWTCRLATKLEIDRDYENSNVKCNETMHEEYTTCEPAEPKTCKNMHEKPKHSTRICFPGCVCKKGYVWDSIGKICVNASECPCHHGGRSYGDGEKIQEDCNTCTCKNGLWSCTERDCAATCSTWGDSHFKTFDGRIYDFQGSCEFVLSTGTLSEYDTFVINIEIVPCGSTGISCPKSISLKVSSPEKEEEVIFRKSKPFSIPRGMQRISVREAGIFVFAEVIDLGITVQWDKGTRVYVKADPKWKNRVKGLCGNFNNNELDDFKTPSSGETSEISPVVFADSWRLHLYCPESYPITDTCSRRPHRRAWAVEKCSIMKSETFETCHSEVPFEPYLERCIVDTCGCDEGGDCECMCTAIAAYAEECTRRGIPIKWRTQELCGLQCEEKGSQYSPCVSPCPEKSCDNQYSHSALFQTCSEESCIEGCRKPSCPPDHVFADSFSNRCIPISSCKTVCLTVNNVTYLEGDLMESDDCHSCFCSHHVKTCSGKPCSEDIVSTTEHFTTALPLTTMSVCPPGEVWDDCIVNCAHVCNHLKGVIHNNSECLNGNNCVSGCRAASLKCLPGEFLRDEYTCVPKRDCPCLSSSNEWIKPGAVIQKSECEKCQCINNEYECVSVCTSPSYTTYSTANYTRQKYISTPGIDFGQEGNVTLIYHTTRSATLLCPTEQYETLINGDCKFSTSSQSDQFSSPEYGYINSSGWIADNSYSDQYLQVDLGRVEPVFAVSVAGTPGKYVTGYYLQYSLNGRLFFDVINKDGRKEVFGGPFDDHHSVKQVLPIPVEARYIRFYPSSWHEGISMKVDVLGCNILPIHTTPNPTLLPSICNKPIGIGQKHFPKLKISVTSSKPNTGPDFIGFDNERGWQPLINSKSEWVQLDFGENVNFTGIITKGVSQGNDLSSFSMTESWVERYKVEYSHDCLSWNPIIDDFGKEMIFMGNVDSETPKKTYFKRPIHARALKILPVKWHENIALRLDVLGCYEPSRWELEVTPPAQIPKIDCNVCKGALYSGDGCICKEEKWWDGEKCVDHSECPCFIGLIAYPVGTTFTTEKCEECICRLYGIPHCTPKLCEDCPPGLQKVLTPLCGCTCKPCKENTRLCPTSNVCLKNSAWCDGIQDCPDDETNCTTPVPHVTPTPKPCKVSCPPGYDVVHKKKTAGPSEADHMVQTLGKVKSVKSKKSVKTYRNSKKSRKHVKLEKMTECPPYDCVPVEEITPTSCPPPECPLDYSVIYTQSFQNLEEACPLYTCKPVVVFANCSVSSRNIKTFDGTDYKYDICDHILAVDDYGSWNVTMFKTCSYTSPCVSGLLIRHGDHTLELHPHNRSIKFNSFPYSYRQVELLNSNINDFTLNPIGNSIIFTSGAYGFGLLYEANGNVRITVPSHMKGHLKGLCGLYNGHSNDDKTLPDGKLAKTTVDFGNSWFNPGGKECVETLCPIDKQNKALEICQILRKKPFTSCSKEVNLELCIESTCDCLMGNKTEEECRCLALSDFAVKCKSPDLFRWRVEYDCPSSCPPNLVHYDCYPYSCEPTCGNEGCAEPANDCYSGCFCPDGLVKRGDECIKLQDCRDCICSGMGDSTYLTFDGGLTFNGNCTYVATKEKSSLGNPSFEVLITNGLCNGSDFMTCTEKVEVKVSGHSIKLIALQNSEQKVMVFIDEHEMSHDRVSKFEESWAEIKLNPETSSVHVELPKEHVEVLYFYNKFAFTIKLPSHYYSDKVEGLCGTCSQTETSEETENPEDWQVDSGNCLLEPVTPCVPTPEHEKICLLMKDPKTFGQCLNFVDPTPFIDQCLTLLCFNGHVCNSLEAYSQACRDVGICVDWRSEDFCPFTCPSDLKYEACKSGCLKTCENYDEVFEVCSKPHIEGCFCPNNQVLINGTCKEEKYCDYCDEVGRHYDGDEWQPDECSNCTCKDRVITCNRVECPVVDIICGKDETLIRDESDGECCPRHRCGCKPRHECPEVEMPNDLLPVGMEAVVNETGCCPRLEIICKKDSCPAVTPCKTHYIQKVVNATDCCPQYICEKPANLCVYDFEKVGVNRVEREAHEEVVKEIGEHWTDGPCKSCVCVEKDGVAEAICMVTECAELEYHHDFGEYELSQVSSPDKCCPEIVRKNCKHNGTIYHVGDSWMPDENNPCETMKCNNFGGQLLKETRVEICNQDCDKGWEYRQIDGKCCGHCVQVGCLAEDLVYKDGETWFSNDGCVKSTCMEKNGHYIISTMTESCPSIEDCPKENVYRDKCCLKCKIQGENKKNCFPQPLPLETTVKLVREKKGKHGLCQNLNPIHNFTQCAGNCDSYSVYKPETWTHEMVCKCCQPEEFSLLSVELKCADGFEVIKSITVPSKCSCMSCGR